MKADSEFRHKLPQSDNDEPLKDDEEYQEVEEEVEDDSKQEEGIEKTAEGEASEFPEWVNGKRRHRSRQRVVKKRIKVRKKIKVKSKSHKKKYKKIAEKVMWTLIIAGFIATMVILVKELDIVDSRNNTKKKSMNKEWFNNHLTLNRISNQINIS